jgi:hypothetical protein
MNDEEDYPIGTRETTSSSILVPMAGGKRREKGNPLVNFQ